jgi:hypothetical protein
MGQWTIGSFDDPLLNADLDLLSRPAHVHGR